VIARMTAFLDIVLVAVRVEAANTIANVVIFGLAATYSRTTTKIL
jgi:hypothetical protein